jgi:4-amino-4-deoxy-L-arabinose transferase-like glycosyltransferase
MDSMVVSAAVSEESKSHSFADGNTRRLTLLFLSLVLATSLGLRAYAWHHWGTGAIESEGAEYARIAENLRTGHGYVGISTPGTQLVFPPLFPSLIAAASLVTHNDYELAGRLVALLLGAVLPFPVFGVAVQLFNRRTAAIAAIVTTLFPLFINLSFTVFSEGPYATVLLTAAYLALRALDQPSIRNCAITGGAFGTAYLIRQEAVAPLVLAVLIGVIAHDSAPLVKIKCAAAAVAIFLVLVSPQVLLLYTSTGKLRLEGKSAINYAWGTRAMAEQAAFGPNGWSQQDADYDAANSINAKLEGTGVGMRPNADVIRETHVHLGELARFFREALHRNTPELFAMFRERWLGAPFLPALALLGALYRPWPQRKAFQHLFFIAVPAAAIATTFTVVHAIYVRNYFILVPFLIIWGANGLVVLAGWTNKNIALVTRRTNMRLPGALLSGLVVMVMLGYAWKDTRSLFVFQEGSPASQAVKNAGLWIQQQQTGRPKIMDVLDTVAFHAHADYVHFPSCNAELALRYIEKEKVDYVILRQGFEPTRYYKGWLTSNIPDPRARLVYSTRAGDPNAIRVYRWNQLATSHP